MRKIKFTKWDILIFILIIVFFIVNLLFLTRYPFVHSDEPWLAGLSRNIMQKGTFKATETFFNLKLRYPHGIKSIFHILQMPFIAIFGYGIFSVRLLSLLMGCGVLGIFYNAAKYFFSSEKKAFFAAVFLACDSQFITASHFARQEIIICFSMVLCLYLFLKNNDSISNKTIAALAVITGLSIGIHPNSFMTAMMCGGILLVRYLFYKTASLKQIGLYAGITGLFALVFIAWSFLLDPNFISHYIAYGQDEFNLFVPVTNKIGQLSYYFAKLYQRISGTYYIPDIRPQFVLFPVSAVLSLLFVLIMKKENSHLNQKITAVLTSVISIIVATVIIGRYNQTSIVFIFPMCWLLVIFAITLFDKKISKFIGTLVLIVIITFSYAGIKPWLSYDYKNYLSSIAQYVPKDSVTIGNLNCEFYFDNGCLLDYRNLSYIHENGLTFEEYVKKYHVEYLIISDELNFIYSTRPKWNMIYGNIDYMDELKIFIGEHCSFEGSFINSTYGVRIIEKINSDEQFSVNIYKVNN